MKIFGWKKNENLMNNQHGYDPHKDIVRVFPFCRR
jgi:hypothetical protein